MASRSHDDGRSIRHYLAQIDVTCSRCANHAVVRMLENRTDIHRPVFPAWLTRTRCGVSRAQRLDANVGWSYQISAEGRAPCFRLPLWLQKPTRHGLVFAFNRRNLSALETFVGTTLRERYELPAGKYRRTLQSRLPRWMKLAANREEVVRALERLHEMLALTRP